MPFLTQSQLFQLPWIYFLMGLTGGFRKIRFGCSQPVFQFLSTIFREASPLPLFLSPGRHVPGRVDDQEVLRREPPFRFFRRTSKYLQTLSFAFWPLWPATTFLFPLFVLACLFSPDTTQIAVLATGLLSSSLSPKLRWNFPLRTADL